jgi:hypothetical protein
MADNRKQKMENPSSLKLRRTGTTVFFALAGVFFCGGCGIVGLMGTPTRYEEKIPAEYDLAAQKGKKVLVLVERPGGPLDAQANLRFYLTKTISENLIAKAKIPPEYIISYKELSEFRSGRSDFSLLSATAVGKALGADIVLLVMVEDYQLSEIAEMTNYYNGLLKVQIAIIETAGGGQVWPGTEMGKSIQVGFEMEKDRETAVYRLVSACAHCTTRYFYNCPRYKFKIADEGSRAGWEE